MTLLGKADTVLRNDKHSVRTVVLVASDLNHAALIGWQDLQKLRVILASFPEVAAVARCYSELKTKTLSAFPDIFSDTLDSCLLYTSPSPRDRQKSRMPSSA